jgi:hypothetical protein
MKSSVKSQVSLYSLPSFLLIYSLLAALPSYTFSDITEIEPAETTTTASDLSMADEVIDSPSLNIKGQLTEEEKIIPVEEAPVKVVKKVRPVQKPLTQSEKIQLYRARLEERNRIMVQRKIEEIRLKQEMALMRKIETQMNNTLRALDTVK